MSSSAIPSSPPSKRSASPSLERSRPSKRSHTVLDSGPPSPPDTAIRTPLELEALESVYARLSTFNDGMDLEEHVHEDEDEELPRTTRKDKGKGKALPQVELPELVWTRIFELYYDDACEAWSVDNQYHHALTPLLISKELLTISMPVFYRHPHVNYRSLPAFARCIKLPVHCAPGTKLSLVRHLTIRPSNTPAVQTVQPPPQPANPGGLRSVPTPPVYKYTIHPSLYTVCQLFSELTSFTLKDTLVRHWSDAKLLFGSLKYLRPRKARLEIRMWDLSESLLGRDLVAASSPNIHAEFSPTIGQTLRWRTPHGTAPGGLWDNQARERWQGENDRTLMMQRWRDALTEGGELHLPAWWIEPPLPSPNFAAAAANQNGLFGAGQVQMGSHNAITVFNNANVGNPGNALNIQNGLGAGMSHLPQSHPPHHSHHRATANRASYVSPQTQGASASGVVTGSQLPATGGMASPVRASTQTLDLRAGHSHHLQAICPPPASAAGPSNQAIRHVGDTSSRTFVYLGDDDGDDDDDDDASMLDEAAFEDMQQQSPVAQMPRGSVLLAARALGRQVSTTSTDIAALEATPESAAAERRSARTTQVSQTTDALERLRDLRMNHPAGSISAIPESVAVLSGASVDTDTPLAGLGHPARAHQVQLWAVNKPGDHQTGPTTAPNGDAYGRNPRLSELSTSNSAITVNMSMTPVEPSRITLETLPMEPTGLVVDPLRSMRMDHIIPTEEELQQYGTEWYLHHREPTPWATRPILRIDPSQSSVPGPRAAASHTQSSSDDYEDDPALTVTYLGVTGHALAHEMRGMLLDLLEKHWSPTLQAFAFQALDPLATLIVRDPRLMLWIKLAIPHIRVHLPRSINSLAVFKDAKTCQRDRHRAARRAEQAAAETAAAAAAVVAGHAAAEGVPANDHESAPVAELAAVPNTGAPNGPPTALIAPTNPLPGLAGPINNHATADASTPHILLEDDDEERVVGGDGHGGELVHDGTRLFEIEVNTLQEMANDEQWYRAGGQLPPQVCRVLAGDRAHDWRDVRVGPRTFSPNYMSGGASPVSPSSSQFLSPTFSFVDLESEGDGRSEQGDGGGDVWLPADIGPGGVGGRAIDDTRVGEMRLDGEERDGNSAGESYDAQAARAQKRVLEERKSLVEE